MVCSCYSLLNYHLAYSLLFFIIATASLIVLFLVQGGQFAALMLGLVYLGAVLVLFFFMILLTNIQQTTRDSLHYKRVPLFCFFLAFFGSTLVLPQIASLGLVNLQQHESRFTSTIESVGLSLFTDLGPIIIILGIILLIGLLSVMLSLANSGSFTTGKVPK